MKKILITGIAGYIGSHLSKLLLEKKYEIIGIDNLSSGKKKLVSKRVKFYKVDICSEKYIRKVFSENSIDTVIHLAASTNIMESKKNPKKFYKNNVIGTKNIVKYSKKYNIKNFIFSSTCAVYGNSKNSKVSEKTSIKPINYYAKTKLLNEKEIKKSFEKTKINYVIFRFFNVIGADPNSKVGPIKIQTLFEILANKIITGDNEINIYGINHNTDDGTCIRDFIDINDLCQIHYNVIKKNIMFSNLILNCGYGKGTSVLEVVKKFEKIAKVKIKICKKPRRKNEISKIYANNNMLIKYLPKFKKHITLEKSIQNLLKWTKKQAKVRKIF